MLKKIQGWSILACAILLTGCATSGGKNYQTDIDALNARVTALQAELSAKDQEIAGLQNEMNDQRMAKDAAETAMRKAEADRRALAEQKSYPSDLK